MGVVVQHGCVLVAEQVVVGLYVSGQYGEEGVGCQHVCTGGEGGGEGVVDAVGHVPAASCVGHAAAQQAPGLCVGVVAQGDGKDEEGEQWPRYSLGFDGGDFFPDDAARERYCEPEGEYAHVADAEVAAQGLGVEDDEGGEGQEGFRFFVAVLVEGVEQGECADGVEVGDEVVEGPDGEDHLEQHVEPVGEVDAEHVAEVVCAVGDLGCVAERCDAVQECVEVSCGCHVCQD